MTPAHAFIILGWILSRTLALSPCTALHFDQWWRKSLMANVIFAVSGKLAPVGLKSQRLFSNGLEAVVYSRRSTCWMGHTVIVQVWGAEKWSGVFNFLSCSLYSFFLSTQWHNSYYVRVSKQPWMLSPFLKNSARISTLFLEAQLYLGYLRCVNLETTKAFWGECF